MANRPDAVESRVTPTPDLRITRRQLLITALRTTPGVGMLILFSRQMRSLPQRESQAEIQARESFPIPPTPVPLTDPETLSVAHQTDDLFAKKQVIETRRIHITTNLEGNNNSFLAASLQEEKSQQIKEVDTELSVLMQTPRFQTIREKAIIQRQEYDIEVAQNQKAYEEEANRLKKEAGINWFSRNIAPIGFALSLGITFALGTFPNTLKRPSWPLREIPVAQPETPPEEPQIV